MLFLILSGVSAAMLILGACMPQISWIFAIVALIIAIVSYALSKKKPQETILFRIGQIASVCMIVIGIVFFAAMAASVWLLPAIIDSLI